MKRFCRSWQIQIVLLIALLLGGVQPVAALAEEEGRQGLRPDAPAYALRGPYTVGTRELVIEDGDEPVYITVWYPALNPENLPEEATYNLGDGQTSMYEIPGSGETDMSIVNIKGHAIQGAAPNIADGPYPLVIFSEGLAAWRHWHAFLHEHLASHGFVVVASDPREVFETFWTGAATRPMDTIRIIDYAGELSATDGDWAGLIDAEKVGVTGHSSGGWAALMGGGAEFDFGWCAANPDLVEENFVSNCRQFVPHQDEVAEMLGLESAPSGLWPPVSDPRIDAVVALAPDGDVFGAGYAGVANVEVPTLLMVGSEDTAIDGTGAIYDHLGSEQKGMVVFENGDHMVFITQCEDMPWIVDVSNYWFCADSVWDMDRTHDLTNHFVTAFLSTELKGDADAAAALEPEAVAFTGISYQAEGYDVNAPTAESGIVEFEAIDVACAEGGVVLSDEPMLAGRSEVEAIQDPEEITFAVNSMMYPDAYPNATWNAPGEGVDLSDGGFVVLHRGEGTGDFEGSTIQFFVTPMEEEIDLPCEPVGPVAKLEGTIVLAEE